MKYHETVDPKSPNVVLFSPSDSPHPYFAEYGFIAPSGSNVKVPDGTTLWQTQASGPLTPAAPVTLTWDNGQGVIFKRTISVDDDYMFKLVDEIENRSAAEISLTPYARVHRYGTPKIENNWILHEGLIGVIGAQGEQRSKYANALEEPPRTFEPATGGWLGFTDKYWASTVIPDQKAPYRATFSAQAPKQPSEQPSYQADYMRDTLKVAAGQTGKHRIATVRRRQADEDPAGLPERRHPAVRPADRLGLVLLHHQAAVPADGGDQLGRP